MSERPPAHLWALPAIVSILRAIPFAVQLADTDSTFLRPVPYVSKDWYQYVALIRQAATEDGWVLYNPFTVDAQEPRYVMLLLSALGLICRGTGLDPFWALELSRIPLLFAFFYVLWRFLGPLLPHRPHRVLACWLVGLSGGLEAVVEATFPWWPPHLARIAGEDLWHLRGWNTFASAYNPMWILGLLLVILTVRPILQPGGPRGVRDGATVAVGFVVLFLTHPYSAITTLAIAAALPALTVLVGAPIDRAALWRTTLGLAPALALAAGVSLWQRQDAVYRFTSLQVLGDQDLPVFWYPVALGAVGFFAVRGVRAWIVERHPWGLALAAWIVAVVFLHTSPILNGYHFVFYLHLPLCVLAAPALAATLQRLRDRRLGVVAIACVGIALFYSAAAVTIRSIAEAVAQRTPPAWEPALRQLAAKPAGNVLTWPELGNAVPAYSPHRVFVGHWFLTPFFGPRSREYDALVSGAAPPGELASFMDRWRIDYIVVPVSVGPRFREALADRVVSSEVAGGAALLVLRRR